MSEIEILQHHGKPPFFRASPIRLKQLAAFLSIDTIKAKPEIEQFIEILITSAANELGCVIDSEQLATQLAEAKLPHSKPIIEKRIRQLKTMGLFNKIQCKRQRPAEDGEMQTVGHVCALYEVGPPIQTRPEQTVFEEDHRSKRSALEDKKREIAANDQFNSLDELRINHVRTEGFFAGYTDRVLRTNQSDRRQSISARFTYKQVDIVSITSDSRTRGSLMTLQDLAVVRAFISTADQIITQDIFGYADPRNPGRTTNQFIIDIVDICTLLQKKGVGSSRDSVRKAIDRINASTFTLTCDPNGPFSRELLGGRYLQDVPFFKEFGAYAENNSAKVRKPRFYQIAFNDLTWAAMESKKDERRIFVANPDLCRVRSGLIQSLWNIARMYKLPFFQGGDDRATRDWPLDLFESFFFPNYGPFLKDLKSHLEPFVVDGAKWNPGTGKGASIALVLGFYVTVYWKVSTREYRISLARDKGDAYVGAKASKRVAS